MDENSYCEFCHETPCRNHDFYVCSLCSTEFTYWIQDKNVHYLDALCMFIKDNNNAKNAHAVKYAKEIHMYVYKSYDTAYNLSQTTNNKNPIPKCALAMVRISFWAPAENTKKWLELHAMMYHVTRQEEDVVLIYTNK